MARVQTEAGAWGYPAPTTAGVVWTAEYAHGLALACRLEPRREYLDAIGRTLRAIVLLTRRHGAIPSRIASWESQQGIAITPETYRRGADRDRSRDYREGRVEFCVRPDYLVYFQAVLREYLRHRSEESLLQPDPVLEQILKLPTTLKPIKHRFLCVDNSKKPQLIYVDQLDPTKSWAVPVPAASRDLQLLPSGDRILVSHGDGAGEYDLATGRQLPWVVSGYSNITSAVRMPDGHTLLARVDGTVYELDPSGKELRRTVPQEKFDIRLIRPLPNGNLLLSGAHVKTLLEMDRQGKIVRRIAHPGDGIKGERLASGNYLTSAGNLAQVIELDAEGRLVRFVGGKAEHPQLRLDYCSGWDLLANGNLVMCNWLGHTKPGAGPHLIEFTPDNRCVWTWEDHGLARQVTSVKILE